jgi:hypothetical protein
MNRDNYLSEWERDYYQNNILRVLPQYESQIKLMDDIELMNCYESNDWQKWLDK